MRLNREDLELLWEHATTLPGSGTAAWLKTAARHGKNDWDCGWLTAAIIQEVLEGGEPGDGETFESKGIYSVLHALIDDINDFMDALAKAEELLPKLKAKA